MTRTSPTSSDPQPWYVRAFDRLYPIIYHHRDPQSARNEIAALFKTLGVNTHMRTLDIACGAGRHLQAMLDFGLDAFGLDLSSALLKHASENPRLRGRLIRADLRQLPFTASFGLAVNLFTSFGYFDDADNLRALRSIASVLTPTGMLVLDHVHRDHLQRNLIDHDTRRIDSYTVDSRRTIENNRMIKRMTVTHPDGLVEHITESVRIYNPTEISALFTSAGLKVQRIIGSFDGRPLDPDSQRMIVIGCQQ